MILFQNHGEIIVFLCCCCYILKSLSFHSSLLVHNFKVGTTRAKEINSVSLRNLESCRKISNSEIVFQDVDLDPSRVTKEEAQYLALVEGLEHLKLAKRLSNEEYLIRSQSAIIKQLNCDSLSRSRKIERLRKRFQTLLLDLPESKYEMISRFVNLRAIELCSRLNSSIGSGLTSPVILLEDVLKRPEILDNLQNTTKAATTVPNKPNKLMSTAADTWILNFDGGSKGNPGLSGAGATISTVNNKTNEEKILWSGCKWLGNQQTNNYAEYQGLILGLQNVLRLHSKVFPDRFRNDKDNVDTIDNEWFPTVYLKIRGDSQLIINQVQGVYRINVEHLKDLCKTAHQLLDRIENDCNILYSFEYVPRALNAQADALANLAMSSGTDYSKDFLVDEE